MRITSISFKPWCFCAQIVACIPPALPPTITSSCRSIFYVTSFYELIPAVPVQRELEFSPHRISHRCTFVHMLRYSLRWFLYDGQLGGNGDTVGRKAPPPLSSLSPHKETKTSTEGHFLRGRQCRYLDGRMMQGLLSLLPRPPVCESGSSIFYNNEHMLIIRGRQMFGWESSPIGLQIGLDILPWGFPIRYPRTPRRRKWPTNVVT